MNEVPRYLPDLEWPPYAYRPGLDPHPTRDPRGHSHGLSADDSGAEVPARWADSRRYLRGIDLFNHGFGWEAHEVWESLWQRPHDATQARWLQALIQLAAASVQEGLGHAEGRMRLCHRALAHLQRVDPGVHPVYMGMDVAGLERALQTYAADGSLRPVLRLDL